ncbi:hypothetical protein [Streptomyces lydicus]|uniref:hypothetical protein n=1 Tax=Streptomyces lydicus TaxID=47763 RepID=UPI00371DA247
MSTWQLVDAKALGEGLTPALEPGPVVDLMAALEASVRAARHARGSEEQGGDGDHRSGD